MSTESLIEKCAERLWKFQNKSSYDHAKRRWSNLTLIEKQIYRNTAEVALSTFAEELCVSTSQQSSVQVAAKSFEVSGRNKDIPLTPIAKASATSQENHRNPSLRELKVLRRLSEMPQGANTKFISKVIELSHPYLTMASTRGALTRLARKGLCEVISSSPLIYRITAQGIDALRKQ